MVADVVGGHAAHDGLDAIAIPVVEEAGADVAAEGRQAVLGGVGRDGDGIRAITAVTPRGRRKIYTTKGSIFRFLMLVFLFSQKFFDFPQSSTIFPR